MGRSEPLLLSVPHSAVCCANCGIVAPSAVATDESAGLWFCCAGCSAVYQIIQSCGLERYYDLKKDGVCFTDQKPAATDRTGSYDLWNTPMRQIDLYIEGIHCSACLWLLEKLPYAMPETIQQSQLALGTSRLSIELSPNGKISDVANLIKRFGYTPHLIESKLDLTTKIKTENRKRLVDLAVAGALSGNTMLMSIPIYAGAELHWVKLFAWISAGLAAGSVFYAGRSLNQDVWRAIRTKTFSIQVPIVFSIWVAFFYSVYDLFFGYQKLYFDSLTMLIFLLLSSRYVLARLRQQGFGQGSLFTLFHEDDGIKVGSIQMVTPEKMLRFDGVIRSGSGLFDLSHLTGESFPVRLNPGDYVYAGSKLVQNSEILADVRQIGQETRMGKIFAAVESQQNQKTNSEKQYDLWARRLFFVVSGLACGNLIWGFYLGQFHSSLHNTLAFLIVTCPCALGLAAPLAQSLIVKRALKSMLLLRDIDAVENVLSVDTVVFDKTGTLTEGQLSVVDFQIPEQFFGVLVKMVQGSDHPVAKAISSHLLLVAGEIQSHSERLILPTIREVTGVGIYAKDFCGTEYFLGRSSGQPDKSKKMVMFEVKWMRKTLQFQIQLRDQLRSDVFTTFVQIEKSILKRHKKTHFEILSGDSTSAVAAAMCHLRDLGLDQKIDLAIGHCTPEYKAKRIQELNDQGRKVLFVGDGINDANAMGHSLVSLAMAGSMQDLKYRSSAVALVSSLGPVSELFRSAELLRKMHKLNFFYSTFYNAASGGLALMGLMTPLFAAFVMPIAATTVFLASQFLASQWMIAPIRSEAK
jgi:P-type E1-E2 ATPase